MISRSLLLIVALSAALCVQGRPSWNDNYNSIDLVQDSEVNLVAGQSYEEYDDPIRARDDKFDYEAETFKPSEGSIWDQVDPTFSPQRPKDSEDDDIINEVEEKQQEDLQGSQATEVRDFNHIKNIEDSVVNLIANSADESGDEEERKEKHATFNHIETIRHSTVNLIAEQLVKHYAYDDERIVDGGSSGENNDKMIACNDKEVSYDDVAAKRMFSCQHVRLVKKAVLSALEKTRKSICYAIQTGEDGIDFTSKCKSLSKIIDDLSDQTQTYATSPVEETTSHHHVYRPLNTPSF